MTQVRAFGWAPPSDKTLVRALRLSHPEAGDSVLANVVPAPSADLTSSCVLLNQLSLGSCQTQAAAQLFYMAMVRAGAPPFVFSRLWAYYLARGLEGNATRDSGASIASVFAVLAEMGVPPEDWWPYLPEKWALHPYQVDRAAYDTRGKLGINYHPIASTGDALVKDIERALTAGYAVAFGSPVGPSYCSGPPRTIVTPPAESEIIGLHAQAAVGFDHAAGWLMVKGSWGDYGDPACPPGCTRFAYEYVRQFADLWIVRALPGGIAP